MTVGCQTGAVPLHTTTYGESGGRVVFLHGLFGQGRNWTQHAKALATDHRVLLVDLPNHGRSGWTEHHDFLEQADQVAGLFDAGEPVSLVGHSMGGKVAMVLALRHPELVQRLCVVDVAPVAYDNAAGFARYIDAMLAIDLETLESRREAEDALEEAVGNPTVKGFLLQNLRREDGSWHWQLNLQLLRAELDKIGGWPDEALQGLPAYTGPVLWIGGSESPYVKDEYAAAMERWFPKTRRVTVRDAGHWVHSEKPEVFLEVLRQFVD